MTEKEPAGDRSAYIELANVSLVYGEGDEETLAVTKVSLAIERGQFVAVVGPSGCGKSTLLKLITGLLPPSAGTVSVNGVRVKAPIKGVGMAFQNPTLLPWRTTLDNILLPFEIVEPHARRFRRHRSEYVGLAQHLLQVVGLQDFGDHYPWQLSGGMQQRANLCRALIHEPDMLMLDEPFGALDSLTREELWDVLQRVWAERRITTVLITHDLREAAFLADSVCVMSQRPGTIVQHQPIDLPRPRTLETTFEPGFVQAVHDLRSRITAVHGA